MSSLFYPIPEAAPLPLPGQVSPPLAGQAFLLNSSQHKALFILIRCTEGKREGAAAKKLSASRKTWALPRHRFLWIFLPRGKGESLKGYRRAKCLKKRNSLFPLQNQNKGIHNYQCSCEHSFNTYAPVRLGCFLAQIGAASLGTTKHRWDLLPVRVDLPVAMQTHIASESHLLLMQHGEKHRLGGKVGLGKRFFHNKPASKATAWIRVLSCRYTGWRKISAEQRVLRGGIEKPALQEGRTYRVSVLINTKRK